MKTTWTPSVLERNKINLGLLQTKTFDFKDFLEAYKYIDANRETSMKILVKVN